MLSGLLAVSVLFAQSNSDAVAEMVKHAKRHGAKAAYEVAKSKYGEGFTKALSEWGDRKAVFKNPERASEDEWQSIAARLDLLKEFRVRATNDPGGWLELADVESKRAVAYFELADADKCLEAAAAAIAARGSGPKEDLHKELAQLIGVNAVYLDSIGREEAGAQFEEAERLFEKTVPPGKELNAEETKHISRYADCLNRHANLERYEGRLAACRRLREQCLGMLARYTNAPTEPVAITRFELGTDLLAIGEYARAKPILLESFKAAEKLKSVPGMAVTTSTLAQQAAWEKNTKDAIRYYKESIIHHSRSPRVYRESEATLRVALAEQYLIHGKPDVAADELRTARTLAKEFKLPRDASLAEAFDVCRRLQKKIPVDVEAEFPAQPDGAFVPYSWEQLHFDILKTDALILTGAGAEARKLRSRYIQTDLERLDLLGPGLSDAELVMAANATASSLQAYIDISTPPANESDTLALLEVIWKTQGYGTWLLRQRQRERTLPKGKTHQLFELKQQRSRLIATQVADSQTLANLEVQISKIERAQGEDGGPKAPPFDPEACLSTLPPNSALVQFVRSDRWIDPAFGPALAKAKPELHAFVLRKINGSLSVQYVALGNADRIATAIETLRENIDLSLAARGLKPVGRKKNAAKPTRTSSMPAAAQVAQLLWEPIKPHLPRTKDGVAPLVCIVGEEAIDNVPWAGLQTTSGRFLVEDYRIIVATDGQTLTETAQREPKKPKRVLLVGHPEYGPGRFAELEGTALEVARIRQTLKGQDVVTLTGAQASPKEVIRQMSGAGVIHLATHFFDIASYDSSAAASLAGRAGRNPFVRPQIALAGANTGSQGCLTAAEILGADLRDTGLVVLSGCSSLEGLRRVFRCAGSRTVVASVFTVEDEATARLMTTFYVGMTNGHAKVDALRQAQLAMIKAGEPPELWAGWLLCGDWR